VIIWLWLGLTVWVLLSPPPPAVEHELMKAYWVLGAVLALGALFNTYTQGSYQVCYDENAIYWRKPGLRGRFATTVEMPFRAITNVFVLSERLGIKPFDAAVLRSETQDVPDIWLSRWYLPKWAIKDVLSEVSRRSEAAFDEQSRKFVEEPDEVGFQP
jgi:hypothetical protein